jgi:hypothetical protein
MCGGWICPGSIFALMLAATTVISAQQPHKLKVLISVDMEGIAGALISVR